jgi:hypothetical protein
MAIGGLCIARTRIHLSLRFAKELLPEAKFASGTRANFPVAKELALVE